MDTVNEGLRRLRNSLILSIASTIVPILASAVTLGGLASATSVMEFLSALASTAVTITAAMALSAILALISLVLMYRGWGSLCDAGLEDSFCLVSKIIKFGTIALLILSLVLAALGGSLLTGSLQNVEQLFGALAGTLPVLALIGLVGLVLWLSIVYGFFKLGSILGVVNLKIGALLLVVGPLLSLTAIAIASLAVTLFGQILLLVTLNGLLGSEIEVVEEEEVYPPEEAPSPGIYEESRSIEARPARVVREETREREAWPEEIPPPRPRVRAEPRAELIGPSGFRVTLGRGSRIFGRRDFAGFVPEDDLYYISRRHFEISYSPQDGYYVRDLGSTNGTWVDGLKLERDERVRLRDGSIIDVAEVVRLKFVMRGTGSGELGVPTI